MIKSISYRLLHFLRLGRKSRWALFGLLILWLLYKGLTISWFRAPSPFEPPAMAAAHYASTEVIGNLGGVPVKIPRYFANFAEYDGDPSWGEKRKGARPARTQQSKLMCFSYHVRYPDMAGESSWELSNDHKKYQAGQNPWINVVIRSGQIYSGDDFLQRFVASISSKGTILKYEKYTPLPELQYGLTVYAAAGMDPKTNTPYRDDINAHDIFVPRNKDKKATAHIRCSNRIGVTSVCQHTFSLEPRMDAEVELLYPRSFLPQWLEIQRAINAQILGFETKLMPTN